MKRHRSFFLWLTGLVWLALFLAACEAPLTATPALPAERPAPTGTEALLAAQLPASPFPTLTSGNPTSLPGFPTTAAPEALPTEAPVASPTPSPIPALRLAVIGDYGLAGQPEQDVANLVLGWQPDVILTTGDNNYPNGEQATIDDNIGQYYHAYISPYIGTYGPGAESNRFFPVLGNHDWNAPGTQPYLDYFTLPGNERYYEVRLGAVHLFMLDSDSREPDGVGKSSLQAAWLQQALAASPAPWKLVVMHHPPYSSGIHGRVDWMDWPFADWGASAVFAGHDHTYERLLIDGIPYFINGLGGGPIYDFNIIEEASQVRYNEDYGAMLITATEKEITFIFSSRQGQEIDTYSLTR